ncbi:MAG TPA: M48 family metalloprotease [Candidatus Eremiobacteraceae bacterium]|nr:M48 family metalloprotease [Candidatus Eremiobacteraceae bacterium]
MKHGIRFASVLLVLALASCGAPAPAPEGSPSVAPASSGDEETQMGQQVWDQLKSQREIVKSSPLYDTLAPMAKAITRVVQPGYPYPIHFYIVHDSQPNAFATPGGNVYVVDSLFYFVKNKEELEGTLCHETSHLLHHDSIKQMQRNQQIRIREVAATILVPNWRTALAASAIGALDELHYSRGVEEAADITGSDTCAAAGYDPWGLVWLFQDFQNSNMKSPPEVLSDHPDNTDRVNALEQHFKQEPGTFANFNSDPTSATKLKLPKDEAEQFVR